MTNNIASELFSITKAFAGGGMVSTMRGVDKSKPDFKIISNLANLFAKEGHEVWILANVHFKSKEYEVVFGKRTGTKYERKCPDLMIDGEFYEYEGFVKPWNIKKVSRMFTHGLKQSDRLIIIFFEEAAVISIKYRIFATKFEKECVWQCFSFTPSFPN